MLILQVVLLVLAVPALVAAVYLAVLTLLSARLPPPPPPRARPFFDIVVPAHDEEAGIGRTVESLLALEWPADRRRVLVVADNCSDRTAERAAAAGAEVLVRHDASKRGKGYALQHAFSRVLADRRADAAVVVDADTVVSPNLLTAFAARLEAGAGAVQAEYAVLNPGASWRTRLMAIAFATFHGVRSLGRERLGLSCGLRGNGMCFAARTLAGAPYDAFSIVEDVEYGLRLGQRGVRVHYAFDADVRGEMVSGGAASRSQRRRWEGGRMALIRSHGLPLLLEALRRRDPVLLDLALDVLVPPLSWVVAYTGAGLAAALAANLVGPAGAAIWAFALPFACLVLYVARGVQLSGMGLAGLAALAWAPAYVLWKVALVVTRHDRKPAGEWVRTAREKGSGEPGMGPG